MSDGDHDRRLGRRQLLQQGALAGLGLGALSRRAAAAPAKGQGRAGVPRYVTLGRADAAGSCCTRGATTTDSGGGRF